MPKSVCQSSTASSQQKDNCKNKPINRGHFVIEIELLDFIIPYPLALIDLDVIWLLQRP